LVSLWPVDLSFPTVYTGSWYLIRKYMGLRECRNDLKRSKGFCSLWCARIGVKIPGVVCVGGRGRAMNPTVSDIFATPPRLPERRFDVNRINGCFRMVSQDIIRSMQLLRG
jgi:hypothetical protein